MTAKWGRALCPDNGRRRYTGRFGQTGRFFLASSRCVCNITLVVDLPSHVRTTRHPQRGFTLLEAALTTVIVGMGIVSIMRLFAVCTGANATAAEMTTALMLAGHIQEATQGLAFNDPASGRGVFGPESDESLATYDDLDDFDLHSFNPPIDALRTPLGDLAQYTQVVSVMPVYPDMPSANDNELIPELPKTAYTGAVRVRVRILFRARPTDVAQEVYRASWMRLDG